MFFFKYGNKINEYLDFTKILLPRFYFAEELCQREGLKHKPHRTFVVDEDRPS